MSRDTSPLGHRQIDNAAHGIQTGDAIAEGRGPGAAQSELRQHLSRACAVHGADVVSQALCVQSPVVMRFAAWVQGREHAAACEVANASARQFGQTGGDRGFGIPVPDAGLRDCEIEDLLQAVMRDPRVMERFAEWLTFERSGV